MTLSPTRLTLSLTRRRVLIAIAVVVVAAMAVVYGRFDPSVAPFPRCAFHTLTGYDCPGCGSQRALHALLGGNLRQAWAFNPLLVVALLALPFYAAAEWWADRWPRLSRTLRGRRACLVLAAVIVVWWIVRNII